MSLAPLPRVRDAPRAVSHRARAATAPIIAVRWPGRKPGTYRWYELQDPVGPLAAARTPRLFYQDIQTAAGVLPRRDRRARSRHDGVDRRRPTIAFLLAMLNSPLYGWYARRRFPPALNGAVRPKLAYMRALPIARPPRGAARAIAALVDAQLATRSRTRARARRAGLDAYELSRASAADVAVARSVGPSLRGREPASIANRSPRAATQLAAFARPARSVASASASAALAATGYGRRGGPDERYASRDRLRVTSTRASRWSGRRRRSSTSASAWTIAGTATRAARSAARHASGRRRVRSQRASSSASATRVLLRRLAPASDSALNSCCISRNAVARRLDRQVQSGSAVPDELADLVERHHQALQLRRDVVMKARHAREPIIASSSSLAVTQRAWRVHG